MDVTGLQVSAIPDGSLLPVQVQPGASRDAVVGVHDGALKLRISAPPVEGAANERCLKFLAKNLLKCPRARLALISGDHGRRKLFKVEGISPEELLERLRSLPETAQK